MGDRIRVGVVGLGVGQLHVAGYKRLRDRFSIVALCDVDDDRLAATASRLRDVELVRDFDQLLSRDDVDVVDLCTPPSLHVEQVMAALAAGKHVICEKPLAGSLADVDRLAGAAAAAGRHLMPIFQYRFGHGAQKLRALVDAGVTGPLHTTTAEVSWRRRGDYYAAPWRGRWASEMGGVLTSHAIHALDLLTFVAGPATRVFTRTATRVNAIEVEDCATASLEMADGSLAVLSATLGSAHEISRHRFCFAHLSAESGCDPYLWSGDPWMLTPDDEDAAAAIDAVLAGHVPLPEYYEGQLLRFADALEAGPDTVLPVTLADARAAIELLTALYVSAREGRDVPLPFDPDHPAFRGWAP